MESYFEMLKLLRSARKIEELDAHREELARLIPQIRTMFDFNQRHEAHPYDLWTHTLYVVTGLPRDIDDDMLYLAALLHDLGKPSTQQLSPKPGGNARHPGHPAAGAVIVRDEVLSDLEQKGISLSEEDARRLLYYVEHHDDTVDLDVKYLRQQREFGANSFETFQNLMHLEVSDAFAHAQIPHVVRRIEVCGALAGTEGERLWREMEQEVCGGCPR